MAMQGYSTATPRINKFKGGILAHAEPVEVLSKIGRQVKLPRNESKTYIARRWLPYGATATNSTTQNQFFQNGTGDRGNALVNAHLTSEGVTPTPDSIVPVDVTVVMQQYACLYGYTDQTFDMYEDDIPEQMKIQTGERVALVNEMINYGVMKGCTNQFYGGAGTSRATVNGAISLTLLRSIAKSLQANHGKEVNRVLGAGPNFATQAVSGGFCVYIHTDAEPDIRDLPGFVPSEQYASGKPMPNEIGKCERFRFITSPDLPSLQDAGAAVGATGLVSTSGSNIDVYPFIVCAQDCFSQVALRGKESLDATLIKPGEKSKSDPLGQRGYYGAIWYKAAMVENDGWMAVGNVGVTRLQ
jgi:N4-gp56 family major capsid protein